MNQDEIKLNNTFKCNFMSGMNEHSSLNLLYSHPQHELCFLQTWCLDSFFVFYTFKLDSTTVN